jgi:ATP-dependent Lon protease
LRVGGVKEKVLAAARSGISHVVLPDANRNDWTEVPTEIRKRLKAHFVRHISELIPLTLREK